MTHTIGMISLGCAKNQVNAEHMLWLLRQAGYEISPDPDGAELVIVNTCGFIESAKTEAIENILMACQDKQENPDRGYRQHSGHGAAEGRGQNPEDSCDRLFGPTLSGRNFEGITGS